MDGAGGLIPCSFCVNICVTFVCHLCGPSECRYAESRGPCRCLGLFYILYLSGTMLNIAHLVHSGGGYRTCKSDTEYHFLIQIWHNYAEAANMSTAAYGNGPLLTLAPQGTNPTYVRAPAPTLQPNGYTCNVRYRRYLQCNDK